jgi:Ca2+-binding RTX toxin-like protein
VIEAAGGGTDRIDAYANHALFANSSVEFIYAMGSAGRSLTGNALANRFISNAAHADTLIGGAGNDTYAVHHAGDRVIEATAGGTDRIDAYANHTLRAGS